MAFPRLVVSYGQVRALRVVVVAVVICVTLVTTLRLHSRSHRNDKPSIYDYTEGRTSPWRDWRSKNNGTHAASPEGKFLKQLIQKHDLTPEVTWSARVVRPKYSSSGRSRPSMTEVQARLLERDFVTASVRDADLKLEEEAGSKLQLTVAGVKGNAVDASTLLFGVSTTYSRLAYANHELIRDWQSWLTDGKGKSNGASLLLSMHKATTPDEMDEVKETLQNFGIDATVLLSNGGDDSASRYIDLFQELKSQSATLTGKTFIGLVDDDVFFPSMGKLVQKLSKFTPSKEYYIGAPSERSDWVIDSNKTVTYGGGAVFLTLPMLDTLTASPCLTNPANKRDTLATTTTTTTHSQDFHIGAQWDLQLYECITTQTTTDLHVLPSFFNPESGEFYTATDDHPIDEGYASGQQPLTLHQYRNVHRFEAGKGHLVTRACGEDCFLQRFHFADDWVLVNGYTLAHYPDGVEAIPLKRHGKISLSEEDEASQKIVGVGKRLVVDDEADSGDAKAIAWAGRKRTWRLLDARVGEEGEVWQAYVKRKDGGNAFEDAKMPGDRVHAEEEKTDKDSIVVLIWRP